MSISPVFSQSFNQSASRSGLILSPSASLDLPDAPDPRALDDAKLSGVTLMLPLTPPVRAGAAPDLPTPRRTFITATRRSFGPAAYAVVGFTSLVAKAENEHPSLGDGVPGLWGYYWRGWLDRTDGNYWVIFAFPSVLHQDEQFHVMQHGRKFYRLMYACSRVLVARDYSGRNTVNGSEMLGRGVSQAISVTYYPSADRSAAAFAARYGYALLRDAGSNVFREFRADLETHILHHRL